MHRDRREGSWTVKGAETRAANRVKGDDDRMVMRKPHGYDGGACFRGGQARGEKHIVKLGPVPYGACVLGGLGEDEVVAFGKPCFKQRRAAHVEIAADKQR